MRKVKVRYQVATYSGTVDVLVGDNADAEEITAKAKKQLRQKAGPLTFGFEGYRIVSEESV